MLYIIATPIGNISDISIRAIETLFTVDVLLCEDTRRTGQLLKTLQTRFPQFIPTNHMPKLLSYYDQNEHQRTPEVLEQLKTGISVGLVSDGGTPLISDPGFRLVEACRKKSIPIISIPGAVAFIAAVTSSGLPTHSILSVGFFSDKDTQRKKQIEQIQSFAYDKPLTCCAYAAPHKLRSVLDSLAAVYGYDKLIVLARELTKLHEETWSGTIGEAKEYFLQPQGEFVLLYLTQ